MKPNSLCVAKILAIEIENNLRTFKVDLLAYPRARIETKANPSTQVDPSLQTFAQDKVTTEPMQEQMAMMNKLSILERERGASQNFPPKPQLNK